MEPKKHLHIENFIETESYHYPSRPIPSKLRNDHKSHSEILASQLTSALGKIPEPEEDTRIKIAGLDSGNIVKIETANPNDKKTKSAIKLPREFEIPENDIVFLNSKRDESKCESGTLFVPEKARKKILKKINDYGRPPVNDKSRGVDEIQNVSQILPANSSALFTDSSTSESPESKWWEIWVRNKENYADQIIHLANSVNFGNYKIYKERLNFPKSEIIFLYENAKNISKLIDLIPGAVSRIHPADITIDLILDSEKNSGYQQKLVQELKSRISPANQYNSVVCILDSGIADKHPLIEPYLKGAWAADSSWGSDDHADNGGHGTGLAGLVLYDDIMKLVNNSNKFSITHGIESVKLLPPPGFKKTEPKNYGLITKNAVHIAEVSSTDELRSFCIACSAIDYHSTEPSTWSGAIDQLASDSVNNQTQAIAEIIGQSRRLVLIATGNNQNMNKLKLQLLEDPAQSWNAITVGGYTSKNQINDPNYQPAVEPYERSPYSLGSQSLNNDLLPIKPEVTFEAGNLAVDGNGNYISHDSLNLLSTGKDIINDPFVSMWGTSAAVGVAGNFIGKLQSNLPELWPETHRALLVDSARWTEPVKKKLYAKDAKGKNISKSLREDIIREHGFGIPNFDRAIRSVNNDTTLISQAEIQPFCIKNRDCQYNEFHVYDLPLPKSLFELNSDLPITMKVTLSYFIEPNLTGNSMTRPDSYRSYGLKFILKNKLESRNQFLQRISPERAKKI